MAVAMGWHKPANVAGSSAPAVMVGLFVASGGLLFGYDTGAINGILAMSEFKDRFAAGCRPELCPGDVAVVVSVLSAGTVVGALLAAPAGDSLGRRLTLLLAVAVFCVGAVCQVCAAAIPLLLVGRALAGVGVGAISVLVPLYQSEVAPKWVRGTLVCAYQLSITLGLLTASVVNIVTSRLTDSSAYRIPLGLQVVPALILTAGLVFLPETPRFLVKSGRDSDAGLSLSRLRRLDMTHPALADELAEMTANHRYELSLGPDTYRDVLVGSPHLGRRTFTGCGLQMLQQLTGINFIMYFSTLFFTGVGVSSPHAKSTVINVINVVSTIPGLLVIESWGRRRLLMVGALGMAACQLLMASFSAASRDAARQQTVIVVLCALNIAFFAASWGPVVWVVTSEIYPLKVRAKAMSLSTASNWALNFAIAYSTPFIMVAGGDDEAGRLGAKIFFIWGAFCLVAVVFVWCMVYETSKISLEQIDEMYERVGHAWHSKSFEPSWSFQQLLHQGWAPGGNQDQELQTSATHSSAETGDNPPGRFPRRRLLPSRSSMSRGGRGGEGDACHGGG
ncbi:regulator of conidiation [Ophiocordyceps camponoti-floridani]|uniref:Regulator of conidiation n=1 Tax=Ophiocordyceps camponoti-floridani TaxID=2030778 RepID=A0A8H4QAR8_9HYPO|nr:regulator of conidiation [Ophiocordyceps camponoti-floridani]